MEGLARWQNQTRFATEAGRPVLIQLIVDAPRHDRLRIAASGEGTSDRMLPDLAAAQLQAERERALAAGEPWAALRVPQLDALAVGQLFQFFLLAELVERQLDCGGGAPEGAVARGMPGGR